LDAERILPENQNFFQFLEPKRRPEIFVDLASLDNYSAVLYLYPEVQKEHF